LNEILASLIAEEVKYESWLEVRLREDRRSCLLQNLIASELGALSSDIDIADG
jgi:hypothetical protein